MKQLTVSVSGSRSESRFLTLLVDVYASDGSILASGTASPIQSSRFILSERQERVHVLGKLPNGLSIQKTVELCDGETEVALHLEPESPHEWLQWVTPFRSISHLRSTDKPIGVKDRRIGKVWMTLWAFLDGRWMAQSLHPIERLQEHGIQQLMIDVPESPHLLQIGGEEVAWRLVSLPPSGRVRIALTRSAVEDGDSLDITVGRAKPDNELIMSYLARGAVAEAERLAEAWDAADLLLYEKNKDPVSAAAGAYVLLKNRRLQHRRNWVSNLVERFPYMADSAIVAAALALQRENTTESEIRSLIDRAIDRGLPIFTMGATILVETMAAVHRGKSETKRFHEAYLAAQAYDRARCSSGAYFAFYGKSPAEPSWTPIYGNEGRPVDQPSSLVKKSNSVIYSRPIDGIQSGKFGLTRVALPRAPVSPEVVNKLNRQAEMTYIASEQIPRSANRLFKQTVDLGIPVTETAFLQEFSVGSIRGRLLQDRSSDTQSQFKIGKKPDFITDKSVKNNTRRQTSKYWREERLNHAVTIFDGDE